MEKVATKKYVDNLVKRNKYNKTLIILGTLLFIGAMLLVGSLDYKVLVM